MRNQTLIRQQSNSIEYQGLLRYIPVLTSEGTPVAYCIINSDISEDQANENAKLVIAAGELLDAVERIDRVLESIQNGKSIAEVHIKSLRGVCTEAIKKAIG